jgi:hypothetical protein
MSIEKTRLAVSGLRELFLSSALCSVPALCSFLVEPRQ